jgi:NADP-reducing hydrogenase subunit HndB
MMEKIRTLQDLLDIREQIQRKTSLREDGYRACITVHMGTCGIASGAREVINAVADALAESGRTDIRLTKSGCIGACEFEPVMTVETLGSEPVLYGYLDAEKARDIFRRHVLEGQVVSEHLVYVGKEPSDVKKRER